MFSRYCKRLCCKAWVITNIWSPDWGLRVIELNILTTIWDDRKIKTATAISLLINIYTRYVGFSKNAVCWVQPAKWYSELKRVVCIRFLVGSYRRLEACLREMYCEISDCLTPGVTSPRRTVSENRRRQITRGTPTGAQSGIKKFTSNTSCSFRVST